MRTTSLKCNLSVDKEEGALDYAQRAAALAPNDSEAQLSPAISYGKMAPLQGMKEQIESARRIKEEGSHTEETGEE